MWTSVPRLHRSLATRGPVLGSWGVGHRKLLLLEPLGIGTPGRAAGVLTATLSLGALGVKGNSEQRVSPPVCKHEG